MSHWCKTFTKLHPSVQNLIQNVKTLQKLTAIIAYHT